MDILSVLGIIVGFGAILGGNLLDGGHIDSLMNGPALVIVLGGTMGAMFLQFPPRIFLRALRISVWIIKPRKILLKAQIKKVVNWSALARKEGLLGLEAVMDNEVDAFALKGLQLLVDGNEPGIR